MIRLEAERLSFLLQETVDDAYKEDADGRAPL